MSEFGDTSRIGLAEQLISLTPRGGLNFHGTSEFVGDSIRLNGLDASPHPFVFYRRFAYDPNIPDKVRFLRTVISQTAKFAVNTHIGNSHGGGSELPLVVAFQDPEELGKDISRGSTWIIPRVPLNNLLGLYTLQREEFVYDSNRGSSVAESFTDRVIEDLIQKLSGR
jgi:hypothetical protein